MPSSSWAWLRASLFFDFYHREHRGKMRTQRSERTWSWNALNSNASLFLLGALIFPLRGKSRIAEVPEDMPTRTRAWHPAYRRPVAPESPRRYRVGDFDSARGDAMS